MTKIYMAHPLGTREKIKNWCDRIKEETGLVIVNPFYDINRDDIERIDNAKGGDETEWRANYYIQLFESQLPGVDSSKIKQRGTPENKKFVGFLASVLGNDRKEIKSTYQRIFFFEILHPRYLKIFAN